MVLAAGKLMGWRLTADPDGIRTWLTNQERSSVRAIASATKVEYGWNPCVSLGDATKLRTYFAKKNDWGFVMFARPDKTAQVTIVARGTNALAQVDGMCEAAITTAILKASGVYHD